MKRETSALWQGVWPTTVFVAAGVGITGFVFEMAAMSHQTYWGLPAWALVLCAGSAAGLMAAPLLALMTGDRP